MMACFVRKNEMEQHHFSGLECKSGWRYMQLMSSISHCSCHRLLTFKLRERSEECLILWPACTSFFYSPQKAEAFKNVQSVLCLSELKVVKPSDTRWLSHKRCVQAIRKELSALIVTLHNIYDDSGDAEEYELALALSSYSRASPIHLLSVVLNLLAKLNCFMQRKATDFSRLPTILKSIVSELKHLKDAGSEWCLLAETSTVMPASEHDITMRTRSFSSKVTVLQQWVSTEML